MPVKVLIPTPLRNLTGGAADVMVAEGGAKDVSQLLAALEAKHPGLKERLCDDSGKLRRFVNVYLNEEDIRFLQGEATALKDGDEVSIVPAIAGGR
jgi:molybdopterin synthase sulfur carrier subunit